MQCGLQFGNQSRFGTLLVLIDEIAERLQAMEQDLAKQ